MRIGSLFTGTAAAETALDGQLAYTCERDRAARAVIAARTHAPCHADVTSLTDPGRVDVLVGGSPCQSASVAGTRAGITPGAPSGLWSHQARLAAESGAAWVVWENVKGARSAPGLTRADHPSAGEAPPDPKAGPGRPHRMRALGRVVADLHLAGLDCAWVSVRASDVGLPHRRERLILLARRRGAPAGPLRLARAAHLGALAGLTLGEPVPDLGVGPAPGVLLPTPAVNDMSRGKDLTAWEEWRLAQRASDGRRAVHGRGLDAELRTVAAAGSWGRYAPAVERAQAVWGPAPDPVEGGRGSTVFIEWMMGLPRGWVTGVEGLSYSQQVRLLGNAVVPAALALGLARAALTLDGPVGRPWASFDAGRDVWVDGHGTRVDAVWPAAGVCLSGHMALPATT